MNEFNVEIKTVPQKKMRYPAAGDYLDGEEKAFIIVADQHNWKYNALVALHEFIEYVLVKNRGIKIEDIDAFDMQYEDDRKRGIHGTEEEPGDDLEAPYRREHRFAENIERQLAHELGVNWNVYDEHVGKT